MSLETLIEHYGYPALLIGAFLEGETILVIAGFAAHRGYLALSWVILIAFLGSVSGDQLWFHVGRRNGRGFLAARPRWTKRAEQLQVVLSRHEVWIVVGFRFLYGFRNITPLVLGASGYRPIRFAVLNIIGAALWSVVVATAGYFCGQAMELLIEDVKHYELYVLLLFVIGGAGIWLYRSWRDKRRISSQKPPLIRDE